MTCITAAMLPALLGRPVAYQPVFAKLEGVSVQGAIFLSQALFLCGTPTARKRDGWFWKEQQGDSDSWEAETGMSAKQQVTARRQLIRIGVLEEVRKGVPAKTWYRVNTEELAKRLAEVLAENEAPEQPAAPATGHNLPSGESENAQPENQESPNGSAQNCPNGDFLQRLQQRSTPPPSDARGIFDHAAELDDQGQPRDAHQVDPPTACRQFPMTYAWQPEPEQLAAACWRRGLPADVTPGPPTLADFTAHFAEKPQQRLTQQGWHERLAKWLAENRRKPQPDQQAPTGGHHHAQRQSAAGGYDRRTERDRIAEQLANPHDLSWAEGFWPEDDWAEPGAQGGDHNDGEPGVHASRSDFPEDLEQCVSQRGPADPGAPGAGAGAGQLVEPANASSGRAGHERAQARREHLAADDPCPGEPAGAESGGLRYAGDG